MVLAGCKTGPEVPVITDPPEAAAAPKPARVTARPARSGTARVAGELVLRTREFGPKPISGQEISLVPRTSETEALMTAHFGQGGFSTTAFPWEKLPADVNSARLRQRSDKRGKFVFRNVPAGSWIATGCMRWQPPGRYVPEGGCRIKRVAVAKGQRVQLRFAQ